MKLAFPLTQTKRLSSGGVKQTCAVGVDVMEVTSSQPEPDDRDHLLDEADKMVAQSVISQQGPDTLPHLQEFSFDRVIGEFQSYAPQLYQLFNQLGDSNRHKLQQHSGLT